MVDGYNIPVMVTTKQATSKCTIDDCVNNLKSCFPQVLRVLNKNGQMLPAKVLVQLSILTHFVAEMSLRHQRSASLA
ncbi:hypothetical protein Ddye_015082 [Dipteronia dyeriana]|uniref:Uncharacterized protein n=1 Tax=Dipteronia dyeriana TaxID=168575 RepID=A0AAD9U4V4_9ROSI|nr:hypothetical protein Ddye_015082 [Dipteronia dyeriana]